MKKKNLSGVIITILIIVIMAGCGSSPPPEWINDTANDDEIWGYGFAKLKNDSLSYETATSRARRELASTLGTRVSSMLKDYAESNNFSSTEFISRINRELTDTDLSGASPTKRTKTDDGTWHVRVALKKTDARRLVSNTFNKEAARTPEFKANEAMKMMDAELAKWSR